jgi:hypothetical protein
MERKPAIPWVLLALDLLGTLLVAFGILGLTGVDFGRPVLATVAPGFVVLGAMLFLPFVAWIVRQARRRQR